MAGEVVWANERYGAVYAIDRPHLRRMVEEGHIPVLHVGQRSAVDAIVSAVPGVQVTTVSLTCPRDWRYSELLTGKLVTLPIGSRLTTPQNSS